MGAWADVNNGEPQGSSQADVSVIAGRIDNLVKALDGTDYLTDIAINGGSLVLTNSTIDSCPIGSTTPDIGEFTDLVSTKLDVDNFNLNGNTIAMTGALTVTTTSNGDINLTPNGTGRVIAKSLKWDATAYNVNTAYQASSDCFVMVNIGADAGAGIISLYSGPSNPPTEYVASQYVAANTTGNASILVKNGDYWKVVYATGISGSSIKVCLI